MAGASILLLAACGQGVDREQGRGEAVAAPGLECATDGARGFGAGCTIERAAGADGTILTIRSPTGSFRRLRVMGGRVTAADGAEPARILGGDAQRVEVVIDNDRYLIPREQLR